jgi:hypothetical protein
VDAASRFWQGWGAVSAPPRRLGVERWWSSSWLGTMVLTFQVADETGGFYENYISKIGGFMKIFGSRLLNRGLYENSVPNIFINPPVLCK